MDRAKLPEYIFGFMPILRRRLIRKHPTCVLPKQHMNVLVHISFEDSQSMKHYAQKLSISKPNMTKVTNSLIEAGYITRGQDAHDRRIISLHMTKSGRELVEDHWNQMKEQIMESTSVLSDEEMQALFDSFETIKEIFEKLDDLGED